MPQWNKAQTEVLDSLGEESNILVAAAAGSGKTAVLVERIIRTVIEGKAGINEILVVTFTRAAAAQMKAKIIKSLEDKVVEDETGRMAEQLLLAEKADIMTIDSFCSKVVRENFSVADIDPAFDIFESDEVKLLQEEVVEEVMDRFYKESESFRNLAGFLMKRNIDDSDLKQIIFNIYKISDSFADPDKWMDEAIADAGENENKQWVKDYVKLVNNTAASFIRVVEKLSEKVEEELSEYDEDLQAKMTDMFRSDIDRLVSVSEADSLRKIAEIQSAKFATFPKKQFLEAVGEEFAKEIYDARDKIKKEIKIEFTEDDIAAEESENSDFVITMLEAARTFRELLMEKKKKQRKYEFADISHAAYQVLFDREKGEPSMTGRRLAAEYKYIYIDEYQDSSDLQENILNALARRDADGNINNVFMVGDVKQSIYRFRQARPELFMDKQLSYVKEDKPGRLINLNMNYRSRARVLDAVNYIFDRVMTPDFGGISYDEGARLHTPDKEAYDALFPEMNSELYDEGACIAGVPLLTLIERDSEAEEITYDEAETVLVAQKIKELVEGVPEKNVKPLYVRNEAFNKDRPEGKFNPKYRPVRYGDIVILMRALTGLTPMIRIFEQIGIPIQVEDTKGYFDAMEIMSVVSTLRVIDNDEQDIPFASMLLSEIGGLSDNDLALIVSYSDQGKSSLAEKCRLFEEGHIARYDAPELMKIAEKLRRIRLLVEGWVKLRPFLTVSELIEKVIKDSDYETFVAAMPDGKRRIANLRMLKIHAEKLNGGKNVGLMDFIRYIDKCEIHDIDFGEASISQDAGNVVRIMSIHKSKGLEFPVVFLSRLGRQFSLRDMQGKMVVDTDYHVAVDNLRVSESGYKTCSDSIKKTVLKSLDHISVKAEEARLLYVAMTRAKEALYMYGSYSKDAPQIPSKSNSLLDYIRYTLENSPSDGILAIEETTVPKIEEVFIKNFSKTSTEYYFSLENVKKDIRNAAEEIPESQENPYEYVYPYQDSVTRKSKASVSEIKHAEMKKPEEDDDGVMRDVYGERLIFGREEINETLEELSEDSGEKAEDKEAAKEKEKQKEENMKRAAMRGTIIHALFEKLNYDRITDKATMKLEFDRVLTESNFTDEERALVNTEYLLSFYSDDENSLFRRMKKAYASGLLKREQQFIAGLPVSVMPGSDDVKQDDRLSTSGDPQDEDYVVIQGIVDAFFYEDDEIVIIDYKTDKVKTGQELLDRYAAQMYLYGHALEMITGKKVKDIIFYSTRIGEVHYSEWRDFKTSRQKS